LEFGSVFPSEANPKYTIKAEIDDGGMGIVYEAHQGELGVVAIKVIKPRILGKTASERFLNEARAMGKVRSEPGIATIFDCDFYTDHASQTLAPYIVMEYIPGAMPLTTYAAEHGLRSRERLELFRRVCEAVGTAHRAEIIHRDLKPANIMVGSSGQPKVIDFGLAVVRDPNEHAKRLPSERGGLFGTLEYMSPEQASKRFDPYVLTPASDVYSLGVILYELLLGQLPYAHHPGFAVRRFPDTPPDYSEATRIIREEAPIEPHKLNRSVHPEVEAILLRALQKDPGKRFADAGEMARAIGDYLRSSLRRDAMRAAPLVLAAMAVAYVVGIPALFRWTPVNLWYQRAASWAAPALEHLQHVVMVMGDERSGPEAFGLGEQFAGADLGLGPNQRQRPIWGDVLRRLADSECKVVAVDVIIDEPAPSSGDDDAVMRGMDALSAKGIECVLGTGEWRDRLGELAPMMRRPGQRHGAVWVHAPDAPGAREPWLVEIALERDGRVMGSLALESVAAWRHPGDASIFDFAPEYEVRVRHAPREAPSDWRLDSEPVRVNRIVAGDALEVNGPAEGTTDVYRPEDMVALVYLPRIPDESVLTRSTIKAEQLVRLPGAELRDMCRDKVVVVANGHTGHDREFSTTPDGRRLPKCWGHALAIESMLRGVNNVGSVGPFVEDGVTLLAGAFGVGLALAYPGRERVIGLGVLAGSVLALGGSLLALRLGGPLLNPVVPVAAMVLGAGLALLLPMLMRRLSA
jgi:CHASE2 domain-containing sensor protein